jgi:hypothetical protein
LTSAAAAPPLLAAAGPELGALPAGISTPLAASAPPSLSAAAPGAEAVLSGSTGATTPVGMSATMTPEIAAATPSTTLPIDAPSMAATTGDATAHPGWLEQTNTFLRNNDPLLRLAQSTISTMTSKRGGQAGGARIQVPSGSLQAVQPPAQLDRLAFLRAFGAQG